jgi:hypothetical protein
MFTQSIHKAIASIFLIGLFGSAYFPQVSYAVPLNWQNAAQVAPPGLMEQVVRENVEPSSQSQIKSDRMRILIIQQPGQRVPLYIIDTRTDYDNPSANPLCGAAGCNFLGYVRSKSGYQRVFSFYLNPLLPENVSLIELAQTIRNGLPCLILNQLAGSQIEQINTCFDGQQYRAN